MALSMEARLDLKNVIEQVEGFSEEMSNLFDLIPEWNHPEAEQIMDRINERILSWITVEVKK